MLKCGKTVLYVVMCVMVSVLLGACASSSVFINYPTQAQQYRAAIAQKDSASTESKLQSKVNSADGELYSLELGRLQQLHGQTDESLQTFANGLTLIERREDKARLSVSSSAAQGASLLTNDNAIPYATAPYEQILLHQYQAMNYLMKNDLTGAGVEARRANFLQKEMLEAHDKDLAKAEEQARKEQIDVAQSGYEQHFSALEDRIGKLKNSFQSAYSFYLTGLIFEAQGAYNDAYIDYRQALQINPANRYVLQDVVRLARQLGMSEDYRRFKAQLGEEQQAVDAEQATLVVLYEDGFIPEKKSLSIPIPTIHGWLSVSMPFYSELGMPPVPLRMQADKHPLESETLADLGALAGKHLKEQYPQLLLRQGLRAATKYAMQKRSESQGGPLLGLVTQVYNLVSEQADGRSWLTLPNYAQLIRTSVPAGDRELVLRAGGQQVALPVQLSKGKIHLLWVVNNSSGLIHHMMTL